MSTQDLLRDMFDRMVVAKDATLVDTYYDPGFVLSTNGLTQDRSAFAAGHRTVYATDIRYEVEYDEDAWVESHDRIAGRMWITTSRPGENPNRIEVVLVATVLNGRFHRLWELTWPDWSRLAAFETYQEIERDL